MGILVALICIAFKALVPSDSFIGINLLSVSAGSLGPFLFFIFWLKPFCYFPHQTLVAPKSLHSFLPASPCATDPVYP